MITRDAVYTAIIENLETADGVQPRGYVKQLVVTGVDKSVDAVMKLLNFDGDGVSDEGRQLTACRSEVSRLRHEVDLRQREIDKRTGEIDGLHYALDVLAHPWGK